MARQQTLAGWDRYGVTWCRKQGEAKVEITRLKNLDTGIIEWHGKVWTGRDRDRPVYEGFHGQDIYSCLERVNEEVDSAQ